MNEQNEIQGDEREDVRAELERIDGYESCPFEPMTDEEVDSHYESWRADVDEDAILARDPFWYCESCEAQNSRLDGECQFCEAGQE